jgi:hypothetical protein
MDQSSLVREQIDAGQRFLREFEKSASVVVAFWLREGEDGRWNLYVASDQFNGGKIGTAYMEVRRIAKAMRDFYFEPFRVKLIGLTEPMAQAALKFYMTHPPKIPFHIRERNFGGIEVDAAYFIQGPTGEYTMPSGREALDRIIDQEAAFFLQHGKSPRKMKLPVLMAYDLSKCGRNEVGDLSGKIFMDGISAFEKEGFHGMSVEIVRERNAALEFE